MPKRLRISLVIPAYNEESHIGACLQTAKSQALPFDEILVVDNNSSDRTAEIARSFPGVRLVSELRQGVVHARTRGFDEASGDIVARIDADTLLPADWTRQAQRIFENPEVEAASGLPEYYDIAFPRLVNFIERILRRKLARDLRDTMFLQGANMAIRKSSWTATKNFLCGQKLMHEDFDLAIHMQEYGRTVVYDPLLVASLSARRVDVGFWQFFRYVRMSPHTYALHGVAHYGRMYPVIIMVLFLHLPARILYRAYDSNVQRFSFSKLFFLRRTVGRVDPTR